MSTFKASNGIVIHPRKDQDIHLGIKNGNEIFSLSRLEAEAAREYFQHERDQEVDRWRWPEDPDIVVYPERKGSVFCFDEATGEGTFGKRDSFDEGNYWDHVARAYFEAHPEKKPWHSAEPGEVWMVRTGDEGMPYAPEIVQELFVRNQMHFVRGYERATRVDSQNIQDAYRIWPQGDEQ